MWRQPSRRNSMQKAMLFKYALREEPLNDTNDINVNGWGKGPSEQAKEIIEHFHDFFSFFE